MLVLAIAASSALVFSNRVELLKLAVILALWAAVVAAFVSVIYRKQSDIDAARARDLKLVYDLQLDREISARREYELGVESQLRRELANELRAQAADEIAALRAELAALRNNLEILFDTDLAHRPALETERTTVRAYSNWERDTETTDPGRPSVPRMTASPTQNVGLDETAIIDVPEEPAEPVGVDAVSSEPVSPQQWEPEPVRRGVHRQPVDTGEWQPVPADGQWLPPGAPGSNWVSGNGTAASPPAPLAESEPRQGRHWSPAGESPGAPSEPEPAAAPAARLDGAEESASGQHDQGQPVSELLARLQSVGSSSRGGRRRRRDG